MNKINYYHSLIFFNLCILLSAFDRFLRDNSLLILSLFLILSLGISHGALDHIKGKKLLKLLNYKSTSTFYILYVLVALSLIILLWFLFSKILLLIFLIVASYHFGKEDAEFINYDKSNLELIYFFKGSLVITAPLVISL